MAVALKRITRGSAPLVFLFTLLVASLYLLSDLTRNSSQFGHYYLWLLGLNSLFLASLAALIAINLARTLRQAAARHPGSRLSLRFMFMFGVLSLLPVAVVFWFSIRFLHEGIDSWFDVRVERALDAALELSQAAFDDSIREVKRQTEPLAAALSNVTDEDAAPQLADLIEGTRAVELTLFGSNNRIIASTSEISSPMVPGLPDDSILQMLSQGHAYVGLDPIKEFGLHIRVIVPVPVVPPETGFRALQALYPVSTRAAGLADEVQKAFGKYHELLFLRDPLKRSLTLSLSLVLVAGVLFSLWAAFFSSQRLMAPILELAEGTRAVASGDFHKKLHTDQNDDLGFLAQSFNQMTDQLAVARDETRRSQRQVESERAHLETVLGHLSSGVLTLDTDGRLSTANPAAQEILKLDLGLCQGRALCELGETHPMLSGFCELLSRHISDSGSTWRQEISLNAADGYKILMCRGARLPTRDPGSSGGHVIVFDDVTALIQAQRDAAWAEVARRLAHEIKNPLTPIQLAAERLRRRLLERSGLEMSDLIDRSTRTIVQQVESMKAMVNAFSDYARTASGKFSQVDVNQLIKDVAELYRSDQGKPSLRLKLDGRRPLVEADPVRLRQVLHNLLKNAQEALGETAQGEILVETAVLSPDMRMELSVSDNGPGIPRELMERLFEPYVTSKPRGTGLGLAIVKRIIEEHGGGLQAENSGSRGGARIRIFLPLAGRQSITPIAAA